MDDEAKPDWGWVCAHGMSEAACLEALLESYQAIAEASVLEQLAAHGLPAEYLAIVMSTTRAHREAEIRKMLPGIMANMALSAGTVVH